jgi:hypothetical protein
MSLPSEGSIPIKLFLLASCRSPRDIYGATILTVDFKGLARLCSYPLAIDKRLFNEERLVFQLQPC